MREERISLPVPMVRRIDFVPTAPGPVFVWDIDKTYLDTRFSRVRDLLLIPFELGIDKVAIPGTVELLHGLREGPDGRGHRPIYFVSASPPEIAGAIERRMLLDGVEHDGAIWKDQFLLVRRGRFSELRAQLAFKVGALLSLAAELPATSRFHLFGDDHEHDALAFCLFADVMAGRLRGNALRERLDEAGVFPGPREAVVAQAEPFLPREVVDGIWIRLERDPSGRVLDDFGPWVVGWPTPAALSDELVARSLITRSAAARLSAVSPPSTLIRGPASISPLWSVAGGR